MPDKRFRLNGYIATLQDNPEAIQLIKDLCPKLSRCRKVYVVRPIKRISPKTCIADLEGLQRHLHIFPTFIHPNGYMFFGGDKVLKILNKKGIKYMSKDQYKVIGKLHS